MDGAAGGDRSGCVAQAVASTVARAARQEVSASPREYRIQKASRTPFLPLIPRQCIARRQTARLERLEMHATRALVGASSRLYAPR